MRMLLCSFVFVLMSFGALAEAPGGAADDGGAVPAVDCIQPADPAAEAAGESDDPLVREARRGCCSWHNGVCGCDSSAGRLRCCDGSLSPTCGC